MGPGKDEDGMLSTINTTPLVDVMLVLLIVFLITVPVVTGSLPVALPKQATQMVMEDKSTITITIDRGGKLFWNDAPLPDDGALMAYLGRAVAQVPQPAIHIRGDETARYGAVGRVVAACHRIGIAKLGFVTEGRDHGG